MTFEELQEKANRRFGRKLSDREIAEVAIENFNEAEAQVESFVTEIEGYREEIHQLRGELSELKANNRWAEGLSDFERKVSERIHEVLSVPCNRCMVTFVKRTDGVPTMDIIIEGHPIGENDE